MRAAPSSHAKSVGQLKDGDDAENSRRKAKEAAKEEAQKAVAALKKKMAETRKAVKVALNDEDKRKAEVALEEALIEAEQAMKVVKELEMDEDTYSVYSEMSSVYVEEECDLFTFLTGGLFANDDDLFYDCYSMSSCGTKSYVDKAGNEQSSRATDASNGWLPWRCS